MYHHMEFDPYLVGERTRQIFGQVQALRLEERLRKNHQVCGSQLIAFALHFKSAAHLLRRVVLAGL